METYVSLRELNIKEQLDDIRDSIENDEFLCSVMRDYVAFLEEEISFPQAESLKYHPDEGHPVPEW